MLLNQVTEPAGQGDRGVLAALAAVLVTSRPWATWTRAAFGAAGSRSRGPSGLVGLRNGHDVPSGLFGDRRVPALRAALPVSATLAAGPRPVARIPCRAERGVPTPPKPESSKRTTTRS